jgi:hypothetical protein
MCTVAPVRRLPVLAPICRQPQRCQRWGARCPLPVARCPLPVARCPFKLP